MYVLDRSSGQVLSAEQFVHVTTSHGVDLKTGRIRHEPSKEPHVGRLVSDACPAAPGAKDWQPSAYSPRTGMLYFGHQNLCMDEEGLEVSYIEGTPYVGTNVKMYAGPGGHRGEFKAWDPIHAKVAWTIKEEFPVWSGTVVAADSDPPATSAVV